jgi:hypothetical protein
MTESEWFACSDVRFMLEHLEDRVSERKARLFGAAACQLLWQGKDHEPFSSTVQLIEAAADAPAQKKNLKSARASLRELMERGFTSDERLVGKALWQAAWISETLRLPRWLLAATVADTVVAAVMPTGMTTAEAKVRARKQLVSLFCDLVGNPFSPGGVDPAWAASNMSTVQRLAQAIYDDRAFDRLPILADALEDAGCTNQEILAHCRSGGDHVRGCWVVDLLLAKE